MADRAHAGGAGPPHDGPMVIAVGSLHGSPGATSLALDLARACGPDALLIEADPDGGCLVGRLDLALRPGLTELAGAARSHIVAGDLWKFAQPTVWGGGVIVAHPAAEQVQAALRACVAQVGASLRVLGRPVIIDIGRIRPGSPALGFAALADHTLIVSANSGEAVVTLANRIQLCMGLSHPMVVLVAASPYPVADVAAAIGLPVWGTVPYGVGRRVAKRRTRALADLLSVCRPIAAELVVAP